MIGKKKPKSNNPKINDDILFLSSLDDFKKSDETLIRVFITAVENNPSSIFITDADGIIHYVNKKFVETTGYSSKEALGETPRILKSGPTAMKNTRLYGKPLHLEMGGMASFITAKKTENYFGNLYPSHQSRMRMVSLLIL
jgi:transcriptional regulator with PAS, ATPase and Fis domain